MPYFLNEADIAKILILQDREAMASKIKLESVRKHRRKVQAEYQAFISAHKDTLQTYAGCSPLTQTPMHSNTFFDDKTESHYPPPPPPPRDHLRPLPISTSIAYNSSSQDGFVTVSNSMASLPMLPITNNTPSSQVPISRTQTRDTLTPTSRKGCAPHSAMMCSPQRDELGHAKYQDPPQNIGSKHPLNSYSVIGGNPEAQDDQDRRTPQLGNSGEYSVESAQSQSQSSSLDNLIPITELLKASMGNRLRGSGGKSHGTEEDIKIINALTTLARPTSTKMVRKSAPPGSSPSSLILPGRHQPSMKPHASTTEKIGGKCVTSRNEETQTEHLANKKSWKGTQTEDVDIESQGQQTEWITRDKGTQRDFIDCQIASKFSVDSHGILCRRYTKVAGEELPKHKFIHLEGETEQS